MYGLSKFVLKKKSHLVFQENNCSENGGALYVSAPGTPFVSISVTDGSIHKCFFVYEDPERDFNDWDTEVVFRGNKAPSVFATSLMNCDRGSEKRGANQALEWKFVKFLDEDGNRCEVSNEVSTDPFNIMYNRSDWNVAPGEVFNPTINLINEKGKVVDGTVHMEVHGSDSQSSVALGGTSRGIFQSISFRNTSYFSEMFIDGAEDEPYNVTLKSLNGPLVQVHINNLKLTKCKDGFEWHRSINRCRCIKNEPGISRCSKDRTKVFIRKGYWAGLVGKNKTFITSPCPDVYCDCPYDDETHLGYECLFQRGNMCNIFRDGSSTLCGKCKQNYTVVLGCSVCSDKCNNYWLFIIIAYGAGILLLVMVIMAINVDAFTGYLNCWLYFYQVLPYLVKGGNQNPFIGFLNIVIALSNLQVHFSKEHGICLAKDLNDADKLMLEYTVPVFALVVAFVLAFFVRRFPGWFYSRRVTNPLRALCTIFVLCYTTITSISIKLLHFVPIGDKYYLYQDGTLEFFKTPKHIVYGSVAIIFVVVVVIPVPAFLMFTPFCTRRVPRRVGNLMPFYDPLQSCFKDQYRCFSAFYFVCRLVLLLIAVFPPVCPLKRAFLDTTCVVFLGFFLYFRPYKETKQPNPRAENDPRDQQEDDQLYQGCCFKKCVINADDQNNNYDWINTSDAILLTTLCVISAFSSQTPAEGTRRNAGDKMVKVFQVILNVLACIPLLVLVFVILRALYVRHKNRNLCATCTVATDTPEQTPVPSSTTTTRSTDHTPVPTDNTTTSTSTSTTRSSEQEPMISGTTKNYGSNDTTPSDLGSNA